MTIDGPVALFKSSTNCSRAPFSAPGPYCWSGPLKARPGPKPPEAPARVQSCTSSARPAPGPAPRELQVTQRRIPALPTNPATTTGAPAATQTQGSEERLSRDLGPRSKESARGDGDARSGPASVPARPPYRRMDGLRLPSFCEVFRRAAPEISWCGALKRGGTPHRRPGP